MLALTNYFLCVGSCVVSSCVCSDVSSCVGTVLISCVGSSVSFGVGSVFSSVVGSVVGSVVSPGVGSGVSPGDGSVVSSGVGSVVSSGVGFGESSVVGSGVKSGVGSCGSSVVGSGVRVVLSLVYFKSLSRGHCTINWKVSVSKQKHISRLMRVVTLHCTDAIGGWTKVTQKPNFFLKNGKNHQKCKNSERPRNMTKFAIRPLTRGL